MIDPRDPQTVYVGAMGHLWGTNAERGSFKTTDGGRHWRKTLFVDEMTGCIDLAADPARSERGLYATMWQRLRSGGAEMRESGPGSGSTRAPMAASTGRSLTNGLPAEPLSKITLAVAQKTPGLVYAYMLSGEPRRGGRTSEAGGVFRSDDGGATLAARQPETLVADLLHAHQGRPDERSPPVHPRSRAVAIRRWRRDVGEAQHEERPRRSARPVDRSERCATTWCSAATAASTCR